MSIDDTCYVVEQGQISGANKDFVSVQHWIDVSNDDYGVTVVSPQGALFEVGGMVNEVPVNNVKVWKTETASSPVLFLYAMNNYWHTNYKADQEGKVRFDMYLKFHRAFNLSESRKFGMDYAQFFTGNGR